MSRGGVMTDFERRHRLLRRLAEWRAINDPVEAATLRPEAWARFIVAELISVDMLERQGLELEEFAARLEDIIADYAQALQAAQAARWNSKRWRMRRRAGQDLQPTDPALLRATKEKMKT